MSPIIEDSQNLHLLFDAASRLSCSAQIGAGHFLQIDCLLFVPETKYILFN